MSPFSLSSVIETLTVGARYNMDHFGEMAWDAYKVAHWEALRKAKNGRKDGKPDVQALKNAYFDDAFGLHYLSDQFAAGHNRNPRVQLNHPSIARRSSN